jgi:hypothetical protein
VKNAMLCGSFSGSAAITSNRLPLPDIVIGGMLRSGTTFLCEMLAKHPGIYVARPFIPEPKVALIPHPKGDAGLLERYASYFADARPGMVRVEKSAAYFENEEARDRLTRILPAAKFIFMLREPVARACSNWRWSTANGLETLPLAEAIKLEGTRASPLPPEKNYVRPFDYIARGRYGTFAEAWVRAVGRNRLAFYLLEDAIAQPETFVAQLQSFIGVDAVPWAGLATGRINATDPDPIGPDPTLVRALRQQLAPEVARFAQVTGVDVSAWGY